MARPTKDGMDYFPHDTDAANDEKIEALRALHGNDGYAFYFIVLERIYRSAGAELNVSKPAVLAALIAKVGVNKDKFNDMLETAFDIECLDKEAYENSKVLTSNGVKKRASEVNSMRDKWRKNKNKKAENKADNPGENLEENKVENPMENPMENAEVTGESKVKESKVNRITTTTTTTFARARKLAEQEFGLITGTISQMLDDDVGQFGINWVENAIKVSAMRGKRNYAYMRSVLDGWRSDGYTPDSCPWDKKGEGNGGKSISQISAKARDQSKSYSEYNNFEHD